VLIGSIFGVIPRSKKGLKMKKILLGTVGLLALAATAPAFAADLPRAVAKAPAPIAETKAPITTSAAYDWSGLYIGANAGAGWNSDKWSADGELGSHTANGATVGAQIGYRYQTGAYVFGVEGQGNWGDIHGRHSNVTDLGGGVALTEDLKSKLDAYGLLTGQVGYAFDNVLLYVKGGAAITNNSWTYSASAPGFGSFSTNSGDVTRWGGVVGAGLEYGLTQNWSVGVNYDHIFTERKDVNFMLDGGRSETARVGGDTDIVTARINYRWGGPTVAKF